MPYTFPACSKTTRGALTAGFTLVELSVVLVILALLTGGILGGQALIKAAELRSITTEVNQWETARNSFLLRYGSLPGDFDDATLYWPAASTCPPTPAQPAGPTRTCNGDGNGLISGNSASRHEAFLFWQHLALAGLIAGEFTGTRGSGGDSEHLIGVNAPASRYPSGGYSSGYWNTGSTNQYVPLDPGHIYTFGAQRDTYPTSGKLLTPAEAWGIDNKIDDGHPARGNVVAHWLVNDCSAADNGNHINTNHNAHYRLEDTTQQCALFFVVD